VVDSLRPYYLRKVRILNGLHTAMVARFTGSGLETVQQVVHDAEGLRWTRDLLYGEIVPTLIGRVADPVAFADATLERFANPFLKHNLSDIRLHHEEKVPVRLQPTAEDYERLYGSRPPLLQAAIDRNLGSV
jgi:tagaturonate reductase